MNPLIHAVLAAVVLSQASPAAPSQGDLAFHAGDFDRAFAAYTSAVAASSNDENALLGLGTMDLYRNDLDGAKMYLSRAAQIAPDDPIVKRRLAAAQAQSGLPADFKIEMNAPEVVLPFVVTDPLPMIDASVNGKKVRLLIDTGARAIELTAAAAARCGVAMHEAGTGTFAGGMKAQMRAGHIDRVALGSTIVTGVPAGELPGGLPPSLGGHPFDGIIGTTMLRQFVTTLDYRGSRLILRPRSQSKNVETNALKRGAAVVRMWLVPDHFIFARARVNGKVDGMFSIDTGGAGVGVGLTKAALSAADITPDASRAFSGMGGGGPVQLEPFTADVAIGSFSRAGVPGLYSPAGDPYGGFPFAVSGAVSHEFFKKSALTFDFESMKLIIE